jgi:hypothetical protein
MGGKFYYRMIDDESFCLTGYYGNDTSVVVPECSGKLTVIFDDIFKRHPEITHIEMPDTVTDIGGFVFDGLWNLKELRLSKSLKNLWQYAITRCGIETVELPEGVKTVSMFAFNECKNLKSVYLPTGTSHILAWAFKNCTSLRDVYVRNPNIEISPKAFEGCPPVNVHYIK